MDQQRRRLELIDEENRHIGNTWIDMPMIDTGRKDAPKVPAWPFEVFLRLPKEVFTSPAATAYQSPAGDLRLFRYSATSTGYNFFLAAGLIAVKEKGKDGKQPTGEYTVDVFRDRVRGAFLDYYRKEYKANPSADFLLIDRSRLKKFTKTPMTTDRGESLPAVEYEAAAYKDTFNRGKEPGVFQVYFHQQDNKQVAIIVEFPAAREGDTNMSAALDWSLRTLDVTQGGIAVKRNALIGRRA